MQNSHIIVPELSALLVSLIDFSIDTNCFKYPPLPWQPVSVSRSSGGWRHRWSVRRSVVSTFSHAGSSDELEAGSEVQRPEGIIDKMAPRTE